MIKVDTGQLRKEAIPKLKSAKTNLTEAINCLKSIKTIPKEFTKTEAQKGIEKRITEVIGITQELSEYISQKAGDFEEAERRAKAAANRVQNMMLGTTGFNMGTTTETNGQAGTNGILGTTTANSTTQNLNWAPSYQGGNTNPTAGYGTLITDPKKAIDQLKSTGATILNGITAFSEGATEMFFGGGEKAFELTGAAVTTPLNALRDFWQYATTGEKGNNNETQWKKTMEAVAETSEVEWQHTRDHQSEASQNWENYVYAPFKIGGTGYNVAKGLGGIYGAAFGPSMINGGGAAIATAAKVSPVAVSTLSTVATAGARGSSEYWNDVKNGSMEGVEEAYRKGEISKEEYQNIVKVQNMSEKEWSNIEKQMQSMKKQGMKESDPVYKQYLSMKSIREMPKDWKTTENLVKGLKYGGAVGAWEGAQFLTGGTLSSAVGSASARVGINTVFNALDPVARAAARSQTDGIPFSDAYRKQGGTGAILTSGLIGFVGSTIGEIGSYYANKNTKTRSEALQAMSPLNNSVGDNAPRTGSYMDQKIRSDMYYDNSEFSATKYSELDYDFEYNCRATGSYGIDQGAMDKMYWFEYDDGHQIGTGQRIYSCSREYQDAINNGIKLRKIANPEYFEVKNILMAKYGMDNRTASTVMSAIDSDGACSYAAVANNIVAHYRNDPQTFERITGIPLYKNVDGVQVINDKEILADLYIYTNSNASAGWAENDKLLFKDASGRIYINQLWENNSWGENKIYRDPYGKASLDAKQQFFSGPNNIRNDLINNYLSAKGTGTYCVSGMINRENVYSSICQDSYGNIYKKNPGFNDNEMDVIISEADKAMKMGAELTLRISATERNVSFYDIDDGGTCYCSTDNWFEGGAHATKITGLCSKGFIVSTWGKRCVLTFEDLKKSGGFNIFYTNFFTN